MNRNIIKSNMQIYKKNIKNIIIKTNILEDFIIIEMRNL